MKQKIILFLLAGFLFPFFNANAQLMRWDKFVHVQAGMKFLKPTRKYAYIFQQKTPFIEAGFSLITWERVNVGASIGFGSLTMWRYNKTAEVWHENQNLAYLSLFSRIYLTNGYRNNLYFLAKGFFGPLMYKIYDQGALTDSGTKFLLSYNFMLGYDLFFSDHFGIFAEAGWGESFVNGGIIYKL